MNFKKTFFALLVVGSSSYLTGCIGNSESECPGVENGVICKGPREVMELTNTRDDLFSSGGEADVGKEDGNANDGKYPTEITPPAGHVPVMYDQNLKNGAATSTISPRSITGTPVPAGLQSGSSYVTTTPSVNPFNNPTAEIVDKTTSPYQSASAPRYIAPNSDIAPARDLYSKNNGQPVNPSLSSGQVQQYRSQGYKQAVVAPEPLAVLQQGKVMRITFAPYTDDNDALNLPGFVYVNVKPQTWIAGKNSTANPARIVPLEVQDAARENMQQQQRATQAVSPNGVVRQL